MSEIIIPSNINIFHVPQEVDGFAHLDAELADKFREGAVDKLLDRSPGYSSDTYALSVVGNRQLADFIDQ